MNQNTNPSPGQVFQTIQVSGNCGPVTIYPRYNNSTLMITECTYDVTSVSKPTGFLLDKLNWPCKFCKKVLSKHDSYTYGCGVVEDNPNARWITTYEAIGKLEYLEMLYDKKSFK